MEEGEDPLEGTGPTKGQKGRPKGKSRSVGPPKGKGKKGKEPSRTSGSRPPTASGRNSGSRPPASRRVTVQEDEPQSRTSA